MEDVSARYALQTHQESKARQAKEEAGEAESRPEERRAERRTERMLCCVRAARTQGGVDGCVERWLGGGDLPDAEEGCLSAPLRGETPVQRAYAAHVFRALRATECGEDCADCASRHAEPAPLDFTRFAECVARSALRS